MTARPDLDGVLTALQDPSACVSVVVETGDAVAWYFSLSEVVKQHGRECRLFGIAHDLFMRARPGTVLLTINVAAVLRQGAALDDARQVLQAVAMLPVSSDEGMIEIQRRIEEHGAKHA